MKFFFICGRPHGGGGGEVKVDGCSWGGGGVREPVFCGRHKWYDP